MWLLDLSSRTVFSYFCKLLLASSPIMLPSTISIPYSRMLRISRPSARGISFMWTPWNRSVLNPSVLFMNKMTKFEVSSSSRWFPCKWRARAQKRHRLLLYGCLMFSSNVRQFVVQFIKSGSGKTASLHFIGMFLSEAANSVEFVKL